MIEPNELSELLNTYVPIEIGASWVFTFFSIFIAPTWLMLCSIAVSLYNLKIFTKDKDHKLHFMTKRDYKKSDYKRIERTYKYKSAVYCLLLGASLIYTIIALVDWLQKVSRRKRNK